MENTQHFAVRMKRGIAGQNCYDVAILAGLGLRRMGRVVYLKDTPAIRGMLYSVVHLVEVEKRVGVMPLSSRALQRQQGQQ